MRHLTLVSRIRPLAPKRLNPATQTHGGLKRFSLDLPFRSIDDLIPTLHEPVIRPVQPASKDIPEILPVIELVVGLELCKSHLSCAPTTYQELQKITKFITHDIYCHRQIEIYPFIKGDNPLKTADG